MQEMSNSNPSVAGTNSENHQSRRKTIPAKLQKIGFTCEELEKFQFLIETYPVVFAYMPSIQRGKAHQKNVVEPKVHMCILNDFPLWSSLFTRFVPQPHWGYGEKYQFRDRFWEIVSKILVGQPPFPSLCCEWTWGQGKVIERKVASWAMEGANWGLVTTRGTQAPPRERK